MNKRMVLLTGVCVVSFGLMTGAANALSTFLWTGDCPCSGRSGGPFACTGDWDTASNWDLPGYPDGTGDQALIRHCNHGCCSNDDDPCDMDRQCGHGNTCEDMETELVISLPGTTTIIHSLRVETADVFTNDTLTLVFTDGTLEPGWVSFDATNGPITFSVEANAALYTDDTD